MRIGPRRRTALLAILRHPRDAYERQVLKGKLHLLGIIARWCRELSREHPGDTEAWWDGLEQHLARYRKRVGYSQALPPEPTNQDLVKRGERMVLERIERSLEQHRYAASARSPLRAKLRFLREFVSAKRAAGTLKPA